MAFCDFLQHPKPLWGDSAPSSPSSSATSITVASPNSAAKSRKRGKPSNSELSEEERRRRRRKQNRDAAQKSRERKKNYVVELEKRVSQLENQNKSLQETVRLQTEQMEKLLARMDQHTSQQKAVMDQQIIQQHQQPQIQRQTQVQTSQQFQFQKRNIQNVQSQRQIQEQNEIQNQQYAQNQVIESNQLNINNDSAAVVSPQLEVLARFLLVITMVAHIIPSLALPALLQNTRSRTGKSHPSSPLVKMLTVPQTSASQTLHCRRAANSHHVRTGKAHLNLSSMTSSSDSMMNPTSTTSTFPPQNHNNNQQTFHTSSHLTQTPSMRVTRLDSNRVQVTFQPQIYGHKLYNKPIQTF